MTRAEKAEQEAEKLKLELAQEKQTWLEKKEDLLSEAKKEVQDWRDRTVAAAKQEVENLRLKWVDRLSRDKHAFYQKLKAQVTRQVLHIGRKVLEDLADEGLDHRVITVFLEKLAGEGRSSHYQDFTGPVKLQSGFDVEEKVSEKLREKLVGFFPRAASIEFEVEKKLGIGIQLLAGDTKVEWNLSHYLEGLEKEILADLSTMNRETA
jgi:F-type H+-transporting ATPase subunit b